METRTITLEEDDWEALEEVVRHSGKRRSDGSELFLTQDAKERIYLGIKGDLHDVKPR
jgi:hypothetical protein